MEKKVSNYSDWYNQNRPHQSLNGATPIEIYERQTPANLKSRYEPRKQWPVSSGCAKPYAKPKTEQGKHLKMVITFADKYKRLPIVELREVA